MKALYWIFAIVAIAEAALDLAAVCGRMQYKPMTKTDRLLNAAGMAVLAWLLLRVVA